MKDQEMPLGDFRFCFRYEPRSQERRARIAALNVAADAHSSHRRLPAQIKKGTETHRQAKRPIYFRASYLAYYGGP